MQEQGTSSIGWDSGQASRSVAGPLRKSTNENFDGMVYSVSVLRKE